MVDLDTTLSLRKPEVQVIVDREAASDLGIPVGTIADTLRILVGGLPVSKFRDGDEQYDVWLRAEPGDRSTRPRTSYEPHAPLADGRAGQAVEPGASWSTSAGRPRSSGSAAQRIVTVLGNPEAIPLGEAVDRAERDPRGDEPAAAVLVRLSAARPRRWARPATTS